MKIQFHLNINLHVVLSQISQQVAAVKRYYFFQIEVTFAEKNHGHVCPVGKM